MAHLPFDLVFLAIVMLTSQLFSKTHCGATENLLIFSVRNSNVIIFDNGTLLASSAPPSLYSLIRLQLKIGTSDDNYRFTLQAVTSRHKICMNRTGKLYTVLNNKHQRLKQRVGKHNNSQGNKRNRTRTRNIEKERKKKKRARRLPAKKNECAFRSYRFPLNESHFKEAIYSIAYSTKLEGRFMAFDREGSPRNLKQPFENIARHARLGMLIDMAPPLNYARLIQNTFFTKNKKTNVLIRKCITNHFHQQAGFFPPRPIRHSSLTRAIRRCRRKYDLNYFPPKRRKGPKKVKL